MSPVDPDFWTDMEHDEEAMSSLERLLRSDPDIREKVKRNGWFAYIVKQIEEERGDDPA